jgi:hypothetical protein
MVVQAVSFQDFYRNPAFSVYRHAIQQQQQPGLRREALVGSKSFDNLSDTFSVSSDDSENFIPRILRPRRRRKKEKRRPTGTVLLFLLLLLLRRDPCSGS